MVGLVVQGVAGGAYLAHIAPETQVAVPDVAGVADAHAEDVEVAWLALRAGY